MSRLDKQVAGEWAEHQVANHAFFSPLIDGKSPDDPAANLATMTATFFSSLSTLNVSDEEKSRLASFYTTSLQQGIGALPDLFSGMDQAQRDALDQIVPHLVRLGIVFGNVTAAVGGEPNRREVEAAESSRRAASAKRRERSEPVLAAALSYIEANPNTSQTACARHVAQELEREQRAVERTIERLFEWRDLPGGAREKRPIQTK